MKNPFLHLVEEGLANLFCKRPESKYFMLGGLLTSCQNFSALLLWQKAATDNLCFCLNKTFFIESGICIYIHFVRHKYYITFFQPFVNVKTTVLLKHQVGQIKPTASVCQPVFETSAFHIQHYSHFGLENSSLWKAVPCIAVVYFCLF